MPRRDEMVRTALYEAANILLSRVTRFSMLKRRKVDEVAASVRTMPRLPWTSQSADGSSTPVLNVIATAGLLLPSVVGTRTATSCYQKNR